ncbi:hypothetical protein BJ166DRAFT_574531 [Pestalotiopsis sp. NC0098]|nr:hypothetical protein BJ166DRAFT_574531 [Pestalotiopsis sp. NC0098]
MWKRDQEERRRRRRRHLRRAKRRALATTRSRSRLLMLRRSLLPMQQECTALPKHLKCIRAIRCTTRSPHQYLPTFEFAARWGWTTLLSMMLDSDVFHFQETALRACETKDKKVHLGHDVLIFFLPFFFSRCQTLSVLKRDRQKNQILAPQ